VPSSVKTTPSTYLPIFLLEINQIIQLLLCPGPEASPAAEDQIGLIRDATSEAELVMQINTIIASMGSTLFCAFCPESRSKISNRNYHMRKTCQEVKNVRSRLSGDSQGIGKFLIFNSRNSVWQNSGVSADCQVDCIPPPTHSVWALKQPLSLSYLISSYLIFRAGHIALWNRSIALRS